MTEQLDIVATGPAPKVPWFRRRPPEELAGFLRRMWWVGHAQLFISAATALIGVVSTAITIAIVAGLLDPYFYAVLTFGVWMLAFALPFLTSGIALRVVAVVLSDIDRPVGRIILGVVYVIAIAVVSVLIVFACTLVEVSVLSALLSDIQNTFAPTIH